MTRRLAGLALAVAVLASCGSARRAIDRSDLPEVPDAPTFEVEFDASTGRFELLVSRPGAPDIDGVPAADLVVTTDDLVRVVVVDGDARLTVDLDVAPGAEPDVDIDLGQLRSGEATLLTLDVAGAHDLRSDGVDDAYRIVSVEAPDDE